MAEKGIGQMTAAELEAENKRLMIARAEVEADFKARQKAVNDELTLREAQERADAALGNLPPDVRRAVLAGLAAKEG